MAKLRKSSPFANSCSNSNMRLPTNAVQFVCSCKFECVQTNRVLHASRADVNTSMQLFQESGVDAY